MQRAWWCGLLLWALASGACRGEAPSPPPDEVRIVSLVPSLTEVAFDLGLGPRVVGVSEFSTWPPEAAALPKVGGGLTPDREALLALRPTLLLSSPSIRGLEPLCQAQGITLVSLKTDTISELELAYKEVGRVGGVEARGLERARALRSELAGLGAGQVARRPRVLLVVGRAAGPVGVVTAAGRGSFLDEVLSAAGGENALAPTLGQWPQVSAEALLASGAEVIIELWPAGDAAALGAQARRDWGAWPQLEAVKAGRVYVLTGDHLLLPGPRVVETARALKARLGEGR